MQQLQWIKQLAGDELFLTTFIMGIIAAIMLWCLSLSFFSPFDHLSCPLWSIL